MKRKTLITEWNRSDYIPDVEEPLQDAWRCIDKKNTPGTTYVVHSDRMDYMVWPICDDYELVLAYIDRGYQVRMYRLHPRERKWLQKYDTAKEAVEAAEYAAAEQSRICMLQNPLKACWDDLVQAVRSQAMTDYISLYKRIAIPEIQDGVDSEEYEIAIKDWQSMLEDTRMEMILLGAKEESLQKLEDRIRRDIRTGSGLSKRLMDFRQ